MSNNPVYIPGYQNFDTITSRVIQANSLSDGTATLSNGILSNLQNPVNNLDAANKQFVLDNVTNITGADQTWKVTANLATNGQNINLDYTTTIIDSVTILNDYRILVKDQIDTTQNGIYLASTTGSWQRTIDCPIGAQASGIAVYIMQGTTNSGKIFTCNSLGSNNQPTTFGNNITFININATLAYGNNYQIQYASNGNLYSTSDLLLNNLHQLNIINGIVTNTIDSYYDFLDVDLYTNHNGNIYLGSIQSPTTDIKLFNSGSMIEFGAQTVNSYGFLKIIGTNANTGTIIPSYITLQAGSGNSTGGCISLQSGSSSTGTGGNISLIPGSGSPNGNVLINPIVPTFAGPTTGSLIVSGGIYADSIFTNNFQTQILTSTNLYISSITNLQYTNTVSLVSNNATITSLNISDVISGNISSTNISSTNLNTTNLYTGNTQQINPTYGILSNIHNNNIYGPINLYGSVTMNNPYSINSQTNYMNFISGSNLYIANSEINLINGKNLSYDNGSFINLFVTNISSTNININDISVANIFVNNITSNNLYTNTATIPTLYTTNISTSNIYISNDAIIQNLTTTYLNSLQSSFTNLYISSSTVLNVTTVTDLNVTGVFSIKNLGIPSLSTTNLYTSGINILQVTSITNLNANNIYTNYVTTTNLYASGPSTL